MTSIPQPQARLPRIFAWKAYDKNTLRGFFSVELPSGMIINHVMLHQAGEARWVALPSREWVDTNGDKQYAPLIEFHSREAQNRFRDSVLAALDAYFRQRQVAK
jgi:DNA-binding cell septation regulator SpoVG